MKKRNTFLDFVWHHRGWAGKAITLSIAAHLALLICSGSIIILRARFSPPAQFTMPPPPPRPALDPHKLEMRAKVQDLQKASSRPKLAPRMVAMRPSDIALPDIKKLTDTVTAKVQRDHSAIGIQGFGTGIGGGFGTGIGGGMGGGLPVMLSGRCDPVQRLRRLQQNGGDSACETAVVRGLRWLATHQNSDGSWGRGNYKCAMTGLALLAFFAHCETPEVGSFTGNVLRGLDYLLNIGKQQDGRLNFTGGNGYPYEHAIATYALAEAYSMTHDSKIEPVLQKAVAIILSGQTSNGGWEYNYANSGIDISVTGWNFQALKAASLTGLKFSGDVDAAMKRGITGIKSMQDNASGNWKYKLSEPRVAPTLTGVGVLCLAFMKEGHTHEARAGCEAILARFKGPITDQQNHHYAWYYNTQACFQVGGLMWSSWRRVFQKQLLGSQSGDGSWAPHDPWINNMDGDGDVYTTSLCTLMLEVYYRYLPTQS
jgi:hypothetical protein